MYARIRSLLIFAACGLVALALGPILGVDAADAPSATGLCRERRSS